MTAARRYSSRILITAGFGFLFAVPAAHGQQQPFVPNVEAQFNALSVRPDPLGFDIANSPDPTTCKHYEGIARLQGADGTPYFVLTRSGLYTPPCFLTDDEPGSLTIVRMGSREKNGERLRSNRLKKGSDLVDTASDAAQDVAVTHRRFNGYGGWPIYGHPESMQTLGNILVVGIDTPLEEDWDRDANAPPMRVLFINAADPENLQIINEFVPANAPIGNREINGGIVAITPLASGRYLMMITGASRSALGFDVFNEKMWFFESNSTTGDADGPTDLTVQGLTWKQLDMWEADSSCEPIYENGKYVDCRPNLSADEQYAGQDWPVSKGREHQMFNFIRQYDINGTLYLAGARGGIDLVAGGRIGDDILDLYRVDVVGDEIKLKRVSSKTKDSHPNAQSTPLTSGESNFAAATGFYVSPSGELLFYATAHDNDGPSGITTVGEWRHVDMVRPESPTLRPTVTLFPPAGTTTFEVPEGGSTTLAGLGEQPVTKAWIELFSDSSYSGRYLVVDFLDWGKDNFDNFKDLDGSYIDLHFGFSDEASSWRWFAPFGTRIRANDHDFGDDGFPGDQTRTLHGTGQPRRSSDLSVVLNDSSSASMGDAITSVQFMEDVTAYYTGRPDLWWDTNRDDSFSTSGIIATFTATNLDGPSDIEVQVKAVHPVDGQAGYAKAPVRVVNVAPVITGFGLFNSLNQELGATVPFFVAGLPVTVRSEFTDPGTPDRQSAVINWGDGTSTPSTEFSSFSDALGGVKGKLEHTRTYAGGGKFNLTLTVTDDDLDSTAQSILVPVLTTEQALLRMIEMLDQIIAGMTDPAVKKVLLDARKALQWNGESGALDKVRLNDPQAALIKLVQTRDSLLAAQSAGAKVATLIALVEQVTASLLSQ